MIWLGCLLCTLVLGVGCTPVRHSRPAQINTHDAPVQHTKSTSKTKKLASTQSKQLPQKTKSSTSKVVPLNVQKRLPSAPTPLKVKQPTTTVKQSVKQATKQTRTSVASKKKKQQKQDLAKQKKPKLRSPVPQKTRVALRFKKKSQPSSKKSRKHRTKKLPKRYRVRTYRRKRKRRSWKRRYTMKRILRWHNLLQSLKGATHYFSARDAYKVARSIRKKYRRDRRRYEGIPKALTKDIYAFLKKLKKLRATRKKQGRNYTRPIRIASHRHTQRCKALPHKRIHKKRRRSCRTRFTRRSSFYPLRWPAHRRYISSRFGWRKSPIHGRRSFHSGLDIAAGHGSPIYTIADGIVVHAGWYGGCGLTLLVRHRNGLKSGYCHLSKIKVKRGTRVYKGQVIGAAGSTGSTTSAHLHFTMQRGRKKLNPLHYLRRRRRRRRRRRKRRRRRRRRVPKLAS